ncbi:MAG: vitamin B12 dependent-methionine synthase activation domain-containing protein, partial [Rudaea sp.]
DLAEIWKIETGGREPRPAIREMVKSLVPEALSLVEPAAVVEFYSVVQVLHNRVGLGGGRSLKGQDVARILGPAQEIAVGVATIGSALEARVAELFAGEEPARGYMLDVLGSAAVNNLVQQVCGRLGALALERGLPIGFPISPGDPGWPLVEQRTLFELLPTETIGVDLTESCLMIPKKSVSFAVGLGKDIAPADQGSQCEICSLRETCRYRQAVSGA